MKDLEKFKVLTSNDCFFEDELVECNATVIGYAPMLGYRAWLFKIEHSYVVLYDVGNCWYTFGKYVSPVWKYITRVYNYFDTKFYNLQMAKHVSCFR